MKLLIFMSISFIILYLYLMFISYYKLHNKDILNKKIIFNMCIWNILHIVFYLILCLIINAKINFYKHFIIFSIGLIWYLTEKKILHKLNNNKLSKLKKNHNNKCYSNIFEPHYTDLIYNIIGQILYIVYYIFKNKFI